MTFQKGHTFWKNHVRTKRRKKCIICKEIITNKKRSITCSNDCKNKWESKKCMEHYRERLKARRLKLRFTIFQRDNFTCQYCGRKAPMCVLEIDHRYPQSKGGLDDEKNYTTACKECNLGKGDRILTEFINT